jgi:hypothetical protein
VGRLDQDDAEVPIGAVVDHVQKIESERPAGVDGVKESEHPERLGRAARHDVEPRGDVDQPAILLADADDGRRVLDGGVQAHAPDGGVGGRRALREVISQGVGARSVVRHLEEDVVQLVARGLQRREHFPVQVVDQVLRRRCPGEGAYGLDDARARVVDAFLALRLGQLPVITRHGYGLSITPMSARRTNTVVVEDW